MVEEPKVKVAAAVFVQGPPAIPPHQSPYHLLHARPRYLGVDALRPAHEHDRQPNMKWSAAALHLEHIVHYAVLHEESMENTLHYGGIMMLKKSVRRGSKMLSES